MEVPIEPTSWDPAERLTSPEAVEAYLEAVLEEGDAGLIAAALDDIARAPGLGEIAREAGVTHASFKSALTSDEAAGLDAVRAMAEAVRERLEDRDLNALADTREGQAIHRVAPDEL
jgi:probable addiction module antidote protein